MDTFRKASFVVLIVAVFQTLSFAQSTPGLFIKVHSENGQSIAGVEVRVESADGFSTRATTDAEGQARVSGLAAGSYRIVAGQQGLEESAQSFKVSDERQEIDLDVS